MRRTQIQLPDWLFEAAQGVAGRREVSLAELVRQGLEYMVRVTPGADTGPEEWTLPEPRVLHSTDPFRDDDWRAKLHLRMAEDNTPNRKKDGK